MKIQMEQVTDKIRQVLRETAREIYSTDSNVLDHGEVDSKYSSYRFPCDHNSTSFCLAASPDDHFYGGATFSTPECRYAKRMIVNPGNVMVALYIGQCKNCGTIHTAYNVRKIDSL